MVVVVSGPRARAGIARGRRPGDRAGLAARRGGRQRRRRRPLRPCRARRTLSVSMPRTAGQVPVHHDDRAGGAGSMFYGDYTDGPPTPLYAFGHGLTYTSFEYGHLVVVASGTTVNPCCSRSGSPTPEAARDRGRTALPATRWHRWRGPTNSSSASHEWSSTRARRPPCVSRCIRAARLLRRGHGLRHRAGTLHLQRRWRVRCHAGTGRSRARRSHGSAPGSAMSWPPPSPWRGPDGGRPPVRPPVLRRDAPWEPAAHRSRRPPPGPARWPPHRQRPS